ncbi:E1-E2 ATPase-domain-containing protein [Bipolaris maydis]|uniref:E1-E2 ATPase-domain-containing protein n=1 Tax=Cochliobolus heterostrophus TaxID=5016 RepID=UPI0024CFFF6E|nr:E1-E2 ATPase-domain-containing protein [Bipolaris maydis]KAJ6266667.1 E1-E2 ATPase-domain-containing protein [Bipolaris maydis]
MEMQMLSPEDGTHRAQILRSASGHNRRASPGTPNPYAETYPVRNPYAQPAKPPSQQHQRSPSAPYTPDTSGVDLDGTPPEQTFRKTLHQNPSDVFPSTPEPPSEMSKAENQRVEESGLHLELPEKAPSLLPAQENLEPVPQCRTSSQSHVQTPQETSALGSQPKPCQNSMGRHLPFAAFSNCCLISRQNSSPATAPGTSSGSQCGLKEDCETTDLHYSTATYNNCRDAEKGPPKFEHVVLRIKGLKCGCCEGGLSRALDRIVAIRNYQVNTVLARAEFDLDMNILCVDDVIKLLTTKTGYNFEEHVGFNGQVLEVIITDPRRLERAGQPKGVIRIEAPERAPWRPLRRLRRLDKTTTLTDTSTDGSVQNNGAKNRKKNRTQEISSVGIHPTKIYYDPIKIGARTLFEHYRQYDPDICLAPLTIDPEIELGAKQTTRALLWFLPTLAFTIPVLVFAWAPVDQDQPAFLHASLALATLVQLVAFREFVPGALRSLYHFHVLEMDFLIAFSTTMAYGFSLASYIFEIRGKPLETGSFFETSTLLVTLILLGRVINEFARFRATKSVSFRSLQIEEALLVSPSANDIWANVKTTPIDSRLLQYGDVFIVPPYTRVVTDGIVIYGGSNVDESMITGEFKPKAKGLSSEVFAGTTNQDGSLVVSLRKLPYENSIQKIATLVEDAGLSKPKAQALADRVAEYFVPAIALIGLVVFLSWLFIDRYCSEHTWKSAVLTAITYAIATLVVSCPCAIGLAVPMVILIASGVAARYGIILRDPQKLELARKVTHVVFDKTGTLTSGRLDVVGVPRYRNTDRARVKGLMMGLLKDIKHPVAVGVVHYLIQDRTTNAYYEPLEVNNIVSFPGQGVQGTCAKTGAVVRAGNADWLKINVIGQESNTRCYFTIAGDLQVSFELKDRTRPGAEMVIEELHAQGIQVHIVSGDTESAVDDAASALHVHKDNIKSRCKPDGKCTYIKDLQGSGETVMFIGDGTNDSAALKQADIGVHISRGSEVAKSAADIILMTTRLHGILILLDISGAAYQRIVANFTWSGLYNTVAIALASGVFVRPGRHIRIKPQWAGLGELISVLPVLLIAFQMQWRDYGGTYRLIENDYQRFEAPKRERVVQTRQSSLMDSAECCDISSSRLTKIDAVTR